MAGKCGSASRLAGMKPEDFDPVELARGTEEELEHTCDRREAQITAMDHLSKDKNYYKKLPLMEKASLEQMSRMTPNRPRIVESEEIAKNIVKRFNDRPVEYKKNLNFSWPSEMQLVGDSLAVAYASNKWKTTDAKGKREKELYKHLAESHNRVMVAKDYLCDENYQPLKTIGPKVYFDDAPMPDSIAILGLFEEANLKLHIGGTNDNPRFGSGRDDGLVCVKTRHAYLGGGRIRWSVDEPEEEDQPFLFVYTNESPDVLMMIIGDELSIEKDGIAG